MTRVSVFKQDMTGTDGTTLVSAFSFLTHPGTDGCEIRGNGFDGTAGGGEIGNKIDPLNTTDTGGLVAQATFADDQWAKVTSKQTTDAFSPGAMVRCASGNGYVADPMFHGGGLEIFRHDAGVFTFLASGGLTIPSAPYDISIDVVGTALEAFIDASSEVTTTDSTYQSGFPGLYSFSDTNATVGDDFEAGNMFSRMPVEASRAPFERAPASRRANAWKANPRLYSG